MKHKIVFIIIIFFCNLTTFSQVVSIPDSIFLKKLIKLGVDKNNDKKIQITEAQNVRSLNIVGGLTDMTGIEAFTSLDSLDCHDNWYVTSLDLSKNTSLTYLNCSIMGMITLDLTKNVNLRTVLCNKSRQLESINASGLKYLVTLDCSYGGYTSNGLPTLKSLNVEGNIALTTIFCHNNKISQIDLSSNIALETLNCSNNYIFLMDVTKNTALKNLNCSINRLQSIDLRNNSALETFNCITNFDYTINSGLSLICINTILQNKIYANPSNWKKDATAFWNLYCGTITKNEDENTILDFAPIRIYPNPAHDVFNISISKPSTDYNIKIADNMGKTVYTSAMTSSNLQINLSQFTAKGLYLIQILDNTNKVLDVKKLVLE